MIKKEKHPSGETIIFNDKYHTFKLESNPRKKFESITKFINRFFPEFDFENISIKYAEKHGLNVEDVRKEWKQKADTSIKLGNACHNYAQRIIENMNIIPEPSDEKEEQYFQAVKTHLRKLFQNGFDVVETEYIIASLPYGIAGIVDLILRKNNTLVVADWKTNAKIEFDSPFNNALEPISHLPDANGIKYALQTGIYEYILKTEGYFPWAEDYKKFLFHVQPEEVINIAIIDDHTINVEKDIERMVNFYNGR